MNTDELIGQAEALRQRIQTYARDSEVADSGRAAKAQVVEFLGKYAGKDSAFVKQASDVTGFANYLVPTLSDILASYIEYVRAGLATGVSVERRVQLDVVSDFLDQAQYMLDGSLHPAAATVLIGASLEEFLRNWLESEGLANGLKPGIDSYATALRQKELITKQDIKDITSWAGTRNAAAHGHWEEVSDPSRARLMLEGVNLFMRKYGDA